MMLSRVILPSFLKEQVDAEVERCSALLKLLKQQVGVPDVTKFVRASLYAHRAIAREWEGLLWRGKVVKTKQIGAEPAAEKSVILSIRPSHFLYLGSLGIDAHSCLKYSATKVSMSKVPFSFILLGYRDDAKRDLYAPQSRAWGASVKRGIVVSNFYGLEYRVMRHAVKETCQEAFGYPELKTPPYSGGAGGEGFGKYAGSFYRNGDGTLLEAVTGVSVLKWAR